MDELERGSKIFGIQKEKKAEVKIGEENGSRAMNTVREKRGYAVSGMWGEKKKEVLQVKEEIKEERG